VLGFAEADLQRWVNPRIGRLDGGAGRARLAAADDAGVA